MKLYYDNLVAYMPDSVIVDGKPIPDTKLAAARKAMMNLSEFQSLKNINALYDAIHQISIYSEINVVDLILTLKDVDIDENKSLEDLLDIAAKNLFQTVTPNYDPTTFDYKYFSAILLYVAHEAMVIRRDEITAEISAQLKNPDLVDDAVKRALTK